MRHYLQFKDFRAEEYAYLFERTREIKKRFKNYEKYQPLVDRTLAMIFEKASTRTRVSFEAGMSDVELVSRLIAERRVAIVPGSAFGPGSGNFARISLAASPDDLRVGITRVAEAINEWAPVSA